MAGRHWMTRFARWHIWLGWLIGVPLVMWTLTGLVMVARPIEEVRGDHLRKAQGAPASFTGNPRPINFKLDGSQQYTEMRVTRQGDRLVWFLTHEDGSIERRPADMRQEELPRIDEAFVRRLVEQRIVGGDAIASVARFSAADAPFDLRHPIPSWQAALEDGTHVYIHAETGEIAAVRTQFWRVFDFMWGLHIMDLESREDTSHPVLILFAALALAGTVLGSILMFRKRKSRARA